jgi:hypothetical protein
MVEVFAADRRPARKQARHTLEENDSGDSLSGIACVVEDEASDGNWLSLACAVLNDLRRRPPRYGPN